MSAMFGPVLRSYSGMSIQKPKHRPKHVTEM